MNMDNLDSYVSMLTDDMDLIDGLSDEVVDTLINYLESEISKKQTILEQLKNENN